MLLAKACLKPSASLHAAALLKITYLDPKHGVLLASAPLSLALPVCLPIWSLASDDIRLSQPTLNPPLYCTLIFVANSQA